MALAEALAPPLNECRMLALWEVEAMAGRCKGIVGVAHLLAAEQVLLRGDLAVVLRGRVNFAKGTEPPVAKRWILLKMRIGKEVRISASLLTVPLARRFFSDFCHLIYLIYLSYMRWFSAANPQ